MQAFSPPVSITDLVSAIGGVVTSCLSLYLVHRRVLADRETKKHRTEECAVQAALAEKLQLKIDFLERDQKPKP